MATSTLTTVYSTTCPPISRLAADSSPPEGLTEPIQDGSLTISPVVTSGDSTFGAEVSGVDWANSIKPEIVQQVGLPIPTSMNDHKKGTANS